MADTTEAESKGQTHYRPVVLESCSTGEGCRFQLWNARLLRPLSLREHKRCAPCQFVIEGSRCHYPRERQCAGFIHLSSHPWATVVVLLVRCQPQSDWFVFDDGTADSGSPPSEQHLCQCRWRIGDSRWLCVPDRKQYDCQGEGESDKRRRRNLLPAHHQMFRREIQQRDEGVELWF